jgi:hypothetical protein
MKCVASGAGGIAREASRTVVCRIGSLESPLYTAQEKQGCGIHGKGLLFSVPLCRGGSQQRSGIQLHGAIYVIGLGVPFILLLIPLVPSRSALGT